MSTISETLYEQTLVIRSQLGDEAAFEQLLELHGPRLREAAKFRSWAFRIARDRIYREYRRRKLLVQPTDDAQLADLPESVESDSTIDHEALHSCLQLISPEHREALVLRFFEEMSYEDIARATDSSVGTVRSRIHYGKEALKKAWKGRTR
jgi:RNA polymerase sigma-70 factor (ECF subfamily)